MRLALLVLAVLACKPEIGAVKTTEECDRYEMRPRVAHDCHWVKSYWTGFPVRVCGGDYTVQVDTCVADKVTKCVYAADHHWECSHSVVEREAK